jgi:arylsulfatase A-like enzyme
VIAPCRSAGGRAGRAAAAVVLALGAAAGSGCARQAPSKPVSIIWIVVDTLRADHLEWYGYMRATAPELRLLVERGVTFDRAYTSQPETTPAIASMLTSLYPYRHGVRRLYYRLNKRNVTAAQLLRSAGYATGAFVSSFVMVRNFSNFTPGFDVYDDFVEERESNRDNYERQAAGTLARAAAWIARHRSAPFFCFIHLIDPHGPYSPPGEFAHRFQSRPAPPIAEALIPAYQQIPGVTDPNRYRDLYDGEIAYASHELGRFFAGLEASGVFAPSLIVFTADHGEEMGEHGRWFDHGQDLFEQNVHIPLIVKPPAGLRAARGSRLRQPVSVVDLLPTVLEAAGLARPDFFQGRSLWAWIAGDRWGGGSGSGSESGSGSGGAGERGVFFTRNGQGLEAGLVQAGRKTILVGDGIEQFDLGADAAERQPLPPLRRDAFAAAGLRAWRAGAEAWKRNFAVEVNSMDYALRGAFVRGRRDRDESLRRLRSLGYL